MWSQFLAGSFELRRRQAAPPDDGLKGAREGGLAAFCGPQPPPVGRINPFGGCTGVPGLL
jgi:hypothetical protein